MVMNNQNNPAYEAMFNDFIQETFGFSFAPWFAANSWDSNYESYSVIENGQMIANVCIYKADMLIDGKKIPSIQFGAVATRKKARGRGLSRMLMEHVLSLYPNTLAYLSANSSVVDFYPKFGFKQIQTYTPQITISINNAHITDVECHLDTLKNALLNRGNYSSVLDIVKPYSVPLFHFLMQYEEDTYHLPKCNAIVVATKKANTLFIADVISEKPVSFNEIAAELPFTGIETVTFGFCPDKLDVSPTWKPTDMTEDPFFIRGDWNLPDKFCFPATSST